MQNPPKACVLFALEGTLSCPDDSSPNWSVIALNRWVPHDVDIIIFSDNSEDARPQILDWLDRYGVSFTALFMNRDAHTSTAVKKKLFAQHIEGTYRVFFVVDHREEDVRMWRSLGLPVLQVAK